MKKTDITELKARSIADLHKIVAETRTALARAKLELTISKPTNVHGPQALRKKLAITQTIIRELELGGQK